MEEEWIIDRAKLRHFLSQHPEWTIQQYGQAIGRCRKWVQKWKKCLQGAAPDDPTILYSQSRAHKTIPKPYSAEVIEQILHLRDEPPETIPRKLGAPAIFYHLHTDETLKTYRLPRSTSTIWKILDAHQRIIRPPRIEHIPFDRPEVMHTWEIDFTDVATAQATHTEKQQHQVEAFGIVDRGSSILVDLQVSENYHAETALIAMASSLIQQGLPRRIVFDRDPCFVGSSSSDEFPSAFMRFLLNLDIAVEVCPPHRPDKKPSLLKNGWSWKQDIGEGFRRGSRTAKSQ